jgi:hypothetical protein
VETLAPALVWPPVTTHSARAKEHTTPSPRPSTVIGGKCRYTPNHVNRHCEPFGDFFRGGSRVGLVS